MRSIIGTVLAFALLMVGLLAPIVLLAGLSGLIWGGRAFEGHLPKDSFQFQFGLWILVPMMLLGASGAICLFVLPILAAFRVQVVSKRERKNALTDLARIMKRISRRYAELMDKIISQERPNQAMQRTAGRRDA